MNQTKKQCRTAELYFRDGKSDKVYKVGMQETTDGQYIVVASWGRRGLRACRLPGVNRYPMRNLGGVKMHGRQRKNEPRHKNSIETRRGRP
jgi:hypothetical protein